MSIPNFFRKLKRSKVYQVAISPIVVAWLTIRGSQAVSLRNMPDSGLVYAYRAVGTKGQRGGIKADLGFGNGADFIINFPVI